MLDLMIVTPFGLLGDEHTYMEENDEIPVKRYVTSAECISAEVKVYLIKIEDFIRECKRQSNWS